MTVKHHPSSHPLPRIFVVPHAPWIWTYDLDERVAPNIIRYIKVRI
jgi:hypothetical protein